MPNDRFLRYFAWQFLFHYHSFLARNFLCDSRRKYSNVEVYNNNPATPNINYNKNSVQNIKLIDYLLDNLLAGQYPVHFSSKHKNSNNSNRTEQNRIKKKKTIGIFRLQCLPYNKFKCQRVCLFRAWSCKSTWMWAKN